MSAFTDEQINEIIGIFTQHMGTRQYIGARYVPLFGRKDETSIIWDNTKPYEPLTIVLYQGNSYTSRQYVPSGVDILNTEFWANTGNYNAQIEQYRTEVLTYDNRITQNTNAIEANTSAIETNTNAIETNTSAIADNTNAIADNTSAIADVTDDIATINANIATINSDNWVTTNRIADNSITENKLADNSVTYDKIADGVVDEFLHNVVRSNFIMPEYIGSFTNYSGMHKELNSADNHPVFAQSMAMPTDDDVKFFVVNKNNTITHIVSANIPENTVNESSVDYTSWGHCNQACFNRSNNRYYINIGSDVGNQINSILVTDAAFNEITRIAPPNHYYYGHMLYDIVTEKMWFVGGLEIYEFDPYNNTFTKTDYELSEYISAFDGSSEVALQGGAVYNNIYACPVAATSHSSIKIFDITTGEKIFTFTLPKNSAFYPIGEVEGCAFDSNGNFYFNSIMCYDTGDRYYSTTVLYKVNFFKGTGVANSVIYSEQPPIIYVECVNYNGFKSTGASDFPCKSLEELSLLLAVLPKTRKVNLGLDSQYSNTSQQDWFGFIQVTGTNVAFHFNGANNIALRGSIISRDNAIIKLRNRATFKPYANASNATCIRCDDGILLTQGVYTIADASMNASYSSIVQCVATGMFIGQYVENALGATTAVSNFNGGFGYVLQQTVKNGSW